MPAFFAPKPDGVRVRLVTDYRLQTQVKSVHENSNSSFAISDDIVQSFPAGSRLFAKLDGIHLQLALESESSLLTTFLLPSGRYRYLRAPMGLSSSSDKLCQQSDRAIEGTQFAKKIVDDILVWADNMPQLLVRVKEIAERCKDLNIILSRKKLMIGNELPFAGLIVSTKGVSPDFAHMIFALRGLTGKNAAFIWLDNHEKEFVKVKRLLKSDMVVTHFDPNLPVIVPTDASRLYSLEYMPWGIWSTEDLNLLSVVLSP